MSEFENWYKEEMVGYFKDNSRLGSVVPLPFFRMKLKDLWIKKQQIIDLQDEIIKKLESSLEFYAQAKILFISKDGEMPSEGVDYAMGVVHGFAQSEVHIKDDGGNARNTVLKLAPLKEKLKGLRE